MYFCIALTRTTMTTTMTTMTTITTTTTTTTTTMAAPTYNDIQPTHVMPAGFWLVGIKVNGEYTT